MTALESYVAQMNVWQAACKKPALSLLNAQDRQTIAQHIDSALSPENLSCDGELPRSDVNRRYRRLTQCAQQLLSIDPTVTIYEFA